jgi:uncharacterized protein
VYRDETPIQYRVWPQFERSTSQAWSKLQQENIMTISMHRASVGVFVQFLGSLSDLLDHAAAHAASNNIDPAVLLHARLYADMYTCTRQVGEAIRHVVNCCAQLAGTEPPATPDAEPDIAELKARIAATLVFIQALPVEAINGTEDKPVSFTFRNGTKRQFTGQSMLLTFSLPQFFFHVTTAYDILRNNGVALTKRNFLGAPPATED